MSLDITLTEDNLSEDEDFDGEVFSTNITHNLTEMAEAAGIYMPLWRPEEIGITKASQLCPLLQKGLSEMMLNPEKFEALNPANGWGAYERFVLWIFELIEKCRMYPDANVSVCR